MTQEEDINSVTFKLRQRLSQFRYESINEESSTHINSIEIALGLVEFALKNKRSIQVTEEQWFKAGYYVDLIVRNSEWEDIAELYYKLIEFVKETNFFR